VFDEHGIVFGDWNDNRKASIEVPISDVCLEKSQRLTCRTSNTTDLCMRISFSQSLARSTIPCARPSTPRIQSTKLNVLTHLPLLLTSVLSRYMPKRKEVHLKKLINAGDEHDDHPESAAETKGSKDQPIVSFWHSNLTLGIVTDDSALPVKTLHPAVQQRNVY
jgi:Cleft lip and palate transmembrane protein 1 (CLPTM1)